MDENDDQPRYEIRVRGLMSDTLVSAFPEMEARSRNGVTVLVGDLSDQAALYGLLARIEALGIELIEVRRLATRTPATTRHADG
jgi:hypothetical protein